MIWQYRPWLSRYLPATARRRRVPTAAPMLGLPRCGMDPIHRILL